MAMIGSQPALRIRARHYATGEPVEVVCAGGKIQAIQAPTEATADLTAGWVAPALFDLQINGCAGQGFFAENLTTHGVRNVVDLCRQHGIGGLLPTVITNSSAGIQRVLETLHTACATDFVVAAAVAGIHLEGPYISAEDGPRGAHPRRHVRAPDWDEFCRFQEAAGGRIRLVTLAPEQDGALRFIEQLVKAGVVVALGHTAAASACLLDAVKAGARLSTHLGNGSHAVLPRHPNYIWEQLAEDGLWASIIADGHHLPASVVRCIVRVKTPGRTILTCDASSLAGLPPGRYRQWEQDLDVLPEGRIVVAGSGYLAGSWAFTDLCVGNTIRFAKVSLREAVDMAGAQPRELLGLPARRLEVGYPSDLVLFDWAEGGDFRVRATMAGGLCELTGSESQDHPAHPDTKT
jgi:N-acetylglucosamine-6-phosphate deacetylase